MNLTTRFIGMNNSQSWFDGKNLNVREMFSRYHNNETLSSNVKLSIGENKQYPDVFDELHLKRIFTFEVDKLYTSFCVIADHKISQLNTIINEEFELKIADYFAKSLLKFQFFESWADFKFEPEIDESNTDLSNAMFCEKYFPTEWKIFIINNPFPEKLKLDFFTH